MLTQKRLKELLHYDPKTGGFTWINPPINCSRRKGDAAGSFDKNGYTQIGIDGWKYFGHRLAWLYITGKFPRIGIDHKNRSPGDDRWANLREATPAQNGQNLRKLAANTSGYCGVSWYKSTGKWKASIRVNRKTYHLGYFDDKQRAYSAYVTAKSSMHTFSRIAP